MWPEKPYDTQGTWPHGDVHEENAHLSYGITTDFFKWPDWPHGKNNVSMK
jgi:hypothetical protein